VDAYEAQVLKFITAPKISKSALQDYMHNMKAIKETLYSKHKTLIQLVHNHNEHNRKWDNERRDDLACRANQACDRAAKKIAAVLDQRFNNHGAGYGGIAILTKNGSYITDDIKTTIIEKRTQDILKIVPNIRTRTQNPDQPDQETLERAYNLTDDEGKCSAARIALGRGTWNMTAMKYAAERDKNGGILKRILNTCGKYSTLCPYCFDTKTGEGKEDHPNHAAEECTHQSARTARAYLEAKTTERQWREGPLGKMNENVYIPSDGTPPRDTDQRTTELTPGETKNSIDTDTNKLIQIKHEDTTTQIQTTLHLYKHQSDNLTKFHTSTNDTRAKDRAETQHDIADLLTSAYKDHHKPNNNPLKYTHLAADTPIALLNWIHKYTRTTCQHMISPLFLTSGPFTEPPTFMPNSLTNEQMKRWNIKEEYEMLLGTIAEMKKVSYSPSNQTIESILKLA
jgi:hypothetical protein